MPEPFVGKHVMAEAQFELEPFVHQVGGHSCMLRYDDTTVCKPLVTREHHFYQTMPDELKDFTPQYRGVIEVEFQEDADGYMTLIAVPPANASPPRGGDSNRSNRVHCTSAPNRRRKDSEEENSGQKNKNREGRSAPIDGRLERTGSTRSRDRLFAASSTQQATPQNPWSLRCHSQQLAKMRRHKSGNRHKFILLENLTSAYHLPCILDLKMGTRQHGDDASAEKIERQRHKCETTTSKDLGVRVCGMQVYRRDKGQFLCRDKYYGRKLTPSGVHASLCEFLYDGFVTRVDLIPHILSRLRHLHRLLSKHNTFRFYSSSLLIMYSGEDTFPDSAVQSDFGGSTGGGGGGSDDVSADGLAAGSEAAVLTSRLAPDQSSSASLSPHETDMEEDSESDDVTSSKFVRYEPLSTTPPVRVRMIDFAHTTHAGFKGDSTLHNGPDSGYLLGLTTLSDMFEQILQERSGVPDNAPRARQQQTSAMHSQRSV